MTPVIIHFLTLEFPRVPVFQPTPFILSPLRSKHLTLDRHFRVPEAIVLSFRQKGEGPHGDIGRDGYPGAPAVF